ncbi:bifunctional DNA primase/polymerase [Streptantibioticus rubrisoli]
MDRQAAKPRMIVVAQQYAARGWRVLPLRYAVDGRCSCGNPKAIADHDHRQGGKHPRYKSWTEDASTDWAVIADWWRNEPNANIGIATGEASGIFVLDIDPDSGGLDSLRALEAEHGPLPKTWTVETGSGGQHRYFAWPGFNPRNSAGKLGPGLDIRADGGQVVAAPSVSVKGPYSVKDDTDPSQAPAWLLDRLRPAPPRPAAPATSIPVRSENLDSYTCKALQAECDAITGAADGEQNNTINTAAFNVGTLVGAGALSEADAHEALLSAALAGNHPEGRARPTIESGLKAGMAQPRHPWPPASRRDDTASLRALIAEPAEPAAAPRPGAPAEAPAPEPERGRRRGLLPEEFWAKREVFRKIRQAAHSQGCSGDVLIYSILARLSGMISPHIRAVTGIGGRASLNLFVGMVGAPGTGKSAGSSLSRDLIPAPDDLDFRDGLPIGTGEGIAETFMGVVEVDSGEVYQRGRNQGEPIMVKRRQQVRHNAYFYIDEGQVLAQLGQRTGSTLAEAMRRAAIGETLGQTNASEERTRYVAAGTYSLGLLVGFQPSTAMPVIADGSTGTPQRFLWCWADDPSIPGVPPKWPGSLDNHPGHKRPSGPIDIEFPQRIKDMLWKERVARNRGEIEVPELDGHAGLIKVKVASLFALLDGGRETVTEDDWELAEIVWQSSCTVRESLIIRAQREAAAERERQETAKVEEALRAHSAKRDVDLALERVARNVRKHASQVGGITWGALNRALASRDRPLANKAVALAISRDWVYEEGDHICVKTD